MLYPRHMPDLVLTPHDFETCGWDAVVAEVVDPGYKSLHTAFENAAEQAKSNGRHRIRKALLLLSEALLPHFLDTSGGQTFGPQDTELEFFKQVVDATNNHWLRARLADILWQLMEGRDRYLLATKAIDIYLDIPVSQDMFQKDWKSCWD
jgi:hypothetical protein